jgi:hypothetical protein
MNKRILDRVSTVCCQEFITTNVLTQKGVQGPLPSQLWVEREWWGWFNFGRQCDNDRDEQGRVLVELTRTAQFE